MSSEPRPLIVGLTGSIGMGKSTIAAMVRDAGVPLFDADAEVHRLQGPGGALLAAIERDFPGTTGPGGVDRGALGARVFGNPGALARLEAIMHPALAIAIADFLERHAQEPLVVLDLPLLFERPAMARVDVALVVTAPATVQRARVMGRPGMTAEKFAAILAAQMPDEEKRARADFIIDNGGALADTHARLMVILDALRTGASSTR